ncbi:MAG: diadenylate cyclase CdaA [Blautia sp.]|nr:diadenylate cyclase CdaA [Blautia sp.]
MQSITQLLSSYLARLTLPELGINDVVEILLLSFFIYQFMVWIKRTRAYSLLKGILMVLIFMIMAYIFNMNTIWYIFQHSINVLIIGIMVIFQPELRKVLEDLGKKQFVASFLPFDAGREVKERFSDKTITELVKACFDMGAVRTGALIVMEQEISLQDYERTGIKVDAAISSQLLINIFEKNTPLHDGAVLIRENRISAATCYLPLSDNMELSKQLGTRHRAGVGISEVSDSVTIIVSEETGHVSVAENGRLISCRNQAELKEILVRAQHKQVVNMGGIRKLWKGRGKNA